MIFEGQKTSYEVIQTLPEAGGNLHYRCRSGEKLCHLAGAPLGEDILSRVALWQENPAFRDLMDYLIWEDRIYLVFPDPVGSALGDVVEAMTPLQRFAVGQQVMEQFLIQDMPLCLQWELAALSSVYVGEDGAELSFFYLSEAVEEYVKITEKTRCERLYQFFGSLFSEEIREVYPEAERFLEQGKNRENADLMAVYMEYLSLLAAFGRVEEAKEDEAPRERLKKFWKKWSGILLSGVKAALGVLTLCAALILLPQVWREEIKPVVDGALLWKQVYVDGVPPDRGEETTPAKESAAAQDDAVEEGSGRRVLYWENGQIRYQGGMQDDQYEGMGTLYYADGTVEYQGGFSFGKREGEGVAYTETGILLYEGQFHNDRYEGEGRLCDREQGSLLYEGGFKSGRYGGQGSLYQPFSDFPLYVGGFRLEHYDGQGLQYDENGCMLYEGDFLLGVYHGNGTIYDPQTGEALFSGAFRNGMPVLTEMLEMPDGDEEADGEEALPEGQEKDADTEKKVGGEGEPTKMPDEAGKQTAEQTAEQIPEQTPENSSPEGGGSETGSPEKEGTDEKSPVLGPVGVHSWDGGPGVS